MTSVLLGRPNFKSLVSSCKSNFEPESRRTDTWEGLVSFQIRWRRRPHGCCPENPMLSRNLTPPCCYAPTLTPPLVVVCKVDFVLISVIIAGWILYGHGEVEQGRNGPSKGFEPGARARGGSLPTLAGLFGTKQNQTRPGGNQVCCQKWVQEEELQSWFYQVLHLEQGPMQGPFVHPNRHSGGRHLENDEALQTCCKGTLPYLAYYIFSAKVGAA